MLMERVRRPKVRLVDVASRANCSAATVSRVLNAPQTVNAEARVRVEQAICALGYLRDGAARALRSRCCHTIGLVLPTIKQPIYTNFIETLQEVLARRGFSLIVVNARFSLDQEAAEARLLAERGVDGLVLIGRTHRRELYELAAAQRLPFVNALTYREDCADPMIGHDDAAAMEQVVAHLFALGHRSFAILAGNIPENDSFTDRVNGARAALAARGVDCSAERIIYEEFALAGGRAGLARALALRDRPTALICASDILAFGALLECAAQGIAVPRTLSVTGFEDHSAAKVFHPALTTLTVPMEAIGRRVADHLLGRISGLEDAVREEIAVTLAVRQTTAAPP